MTCLPLFGNVKCRPGISFRYSLEYKFLELVSFCHILHLNQRMETLNVNYSLFAENISRGFKALQNVPSLTDVTLVCDDGEVAAHKLVLFTGSDFFQNFLPRVKHPNPYIYLRGIKLQHLNSVLTFMYNGEAEIAEDDIHFVLDVAKDLKVAGLTENEKDLEPEFVMEEAAKVSRKLEELKKKLSSSISEKKEAVTVPTENNNDKEEVHHQTDSDLDEKALLKMEKVKDANGKVSWVCKDCGFSSNDKTRTRRHVKSNHLKDKKRSIMSVESNDLTEEIKSALEKDVTLGEVLLDSENESSSEMETPKPRKSIKREHQEENVTENIMEKIHALDDEPSESINGETDANETLEFSNDMDEQALDLMEKNYDELKKVSWTCKVCEYSCNDKTRTKRHVKAKHIKRQKMDEKEDDSMMNTSTNEESLKEESFVKGGNFDSIDIQALSMMTKTKSETGTTIWNCTICEQNSFDKTRIRKHVKSHHIKNNENIEAEMDIKPIL